MDIDVMARKKSNENTYMEKYMCEMNIFFYNRYKTMLWIEDFEGMP